MFFETQCNTGKKSPEGKGTVLGHRRHCNVLAKLNVFDFSFWLFFLMLMLNLFAVLPPLIAYDIHV